jgi:hypothetical protein
VLIFPFDLPAHTQLQNRALSPFFDQQNILPQVSQDLRQFNLLSFSAGSKYLGIKIIVIPIDIQTQQL